MISTFRTLFSWRSALGLILALAAAPAIAQTAAVTAISAEEARRAALAGEILLIDLRTPAEWRESGIPDAAIGIDVSSPDFVAKFMEAVDGDRTRRVAFICRSGGRSGGASHALAEAGFTQIYDVSEGTHGSGAGPGWLQRGLPTRAPDEVAPLNKGSGVSGD